MNGVETYQDIAVTTQTKGQLIVILYDGAVKFLKMASSSIEAGNFEAKGRYITKALNIINELNTTLNMEAGGEVAINLRKLYTFMTNRINEASVSQDVQKIDEVIKLLEELNQSWKAIAV